MKAFGSGEATALVVVPWAFVLVPVIVLIGADYYP